MTTELEIKPKVGSYDIGLALKQATTFRSQSLPIGMLHRGKEHTSTNTFLMGKMIKQLGVFKWIEPSVSKTEATEYARFHESDTLVDIVPNTPFCFSNPFQKEGDVNIDNYILNNCLSDKPRIFLGHSALSLLRDGSYIAELPYQSSKSKRNMFLTQMGKILFPDAVKTNTDCHGQVKQSYVIDVQDCLILRSYNEDKDFVPLAYTQRPVGKGEKEEKHIVAFYVKDTNSIGILYNPERTIHEESSREFRNTGYNYGCSFFLAILKDTLMRAASDIKVLNNKNLK